MKLQNYQLFTNLFFWKEENNNDDKKHTHKQKKNPKKPDVKKQKTSTRKGAQYHYSLGNTNKNSNELLLHTQ